MIDRAARLVRTIPYGEVGRYTQLAIASAAMNLGLPVLLHEWGGMSERIAVAVALVTAFVVNFIVARSYVFEADGAFGPQMIRFAAASAGFRIAEYLGFLLLHAVFGLFYVVALAIVLVVSFGVKFAFYRTYVFSKTGDGDYGPPPMQFAKRMQSWMEPTNVSSKLIESKGMLLLGALFVFYFFYPHQGFDGLIPDNIAQTAYFSLLSRPELVGSIGSSSPKGGLVILLGLAQLLSYEVLGSAWLFKAMLASFFAAMLYLIGKIAAQSGGPIAMLLAVLVAAGAGYPTLTFYTGSSNLFFLPPVLLGLWFLSSGKDRAGIVSLCGAITIRPEAVIIVGLVIVIRYLRRGDWRGTLEYSTYAALAMLFYMLMAYWSQGAWERMGGGAATGYPAFESLRTVEHMRQIFGQFFAERFVALLSLPALYTLARVERARTYVYFYSMVLAFAFLVIIGFFGMHYRYIAPGQVVIFALGCAGLMQIYADLHRPDGGVRAFPALGSMNAVVAMAAIAVLMLAIAFWSTRSVATCLTMLAIPAVYVLIGASGEATGARRLLPGCHAAVLLLLAAASVASALEAHRTFSASLDTVHPAVLDAREFLADPQIPIGASVIAEDEMLNYAIVKNPDFFARARSIQSFNVMTDSERRQVLSRAQYLYVSKRRNYGWNYLFYFPRATWVTDPFRTAVLQMIRTNRARRILGVVLNPVYNSDSRFIARIDTAPGGASESQ